MTHQPLPAFAATSGPSPCKILFIGEAWGGNEAETKRPFLGEAGKEFWRMLGEAWPEASPELHAEATELHKYGSAWVKKRERWLEAEGLAMTNVFAFRPPGNSIPALCASKKEVGKDYQLPAVKQGKYVLPEFLPELDRLFEEINQFNPTLIVAFGNVPCWALLRTTNISGLRGTVLLTHSALPLRRQFKVLPTYHPAAILYNWSWRPIVVADLMKAKREAEFPEVRRPARRVKINPTLQEVWKFRDRLLACPPKLLSCDIETEAKQIKTIGFAWSQTEAFNIPFMNVKSPDGSYWKTLEEELEAWKVVQQLLEHPVHKLGQNFIYDLQYITKMGIAPRNCLQDTMLLHHSLFPELSKGLGFLGSIYTEEPAWKLMRKHKGSEAEKKDE